MFPKFLQRDARSEKVFFAAALLFNNWLFALLLNTKIIRKGGSISELSAASQPAHLLFRSLDILAGLALAAAGYLLLKKTPWRPLAPIVVALGAADIVDALLPLHCAGSVDRFCNSSVSLSLSRWSVPEHSYSSIIIGICYLLLPVISMFYIQTRRFLAASLLSLLTTLIFFALLFTESLRGSYSGQSLVGYSQMIQMLFFGWWLVEIGRAASLASRPQKPPKEPAAKNN